MPKIDTYVTIPLPLDIELGALISDGTMVVNFRFKSKDEAYAVVTKLKQEIVDARKD